MVIETIIEMIRKKFILFGFQEFEIIVVFELTIRYVVLDFARFLLKKFYLNLIDRFGIYIHKNEKRYFNLCDPVSFTTF